MVEVLNPEQEKVSEEQAAKEQAAFESKAVVNADYQEYKQAQADKLRAHEAEQGKAYFVPPTIGRIVNIVMADDRHPPVIRPMIITAVHGENYVNGQVFLDGANDYRFTDGKDQNTLWAGTVGYDANATRAYSWHYPTRI